MNLYLISQNVNNGYDTYSSAVVSADCAHSAKKVHPDGSLWDVRRQIWYRLNENSEPYKSWGNENWAPATKVKAQLIGKYNQNVSKVICSSYHAG